MSINAYTRTNNNRRPALTSLAEEEAGPTTTGHLYNARARRPRRDRQSVTWDPTLDIYNDTFAFKHLATEEAKQELLTGQDHVFDVTLPTNRRSTLLAQPARKVRLDPAAGLNVNDANMKRRRVSGIQAVVQAPYSLRAQAHPTLVPPEMTLEIKKEPRRRTIYIPSDDTTIATIHPGASMRLANAGPRRPRQSDIFLDLAALPEGGPTPTIEQHAIAGLDHRQKRLGRQSLSVAPRRAPLQQSQRVMQATAIMHDVAGSGGGKENLPPRVEKFDAKLRKDFTLDLQDMTITRSPKRPEAIRDSPKCRLTFASGPASPLQARSPKAPRPSSLNRRLSSLKISENPEICPAPRRRTSVIPHQSTMRLTVQPPVPAVSVQQSRKPDAIPFKLSVPSLSGSANISRDRYQVLSEDISKPELYEDNWLAHQETALSGCINLLFNETGHKSATIVQPREDLRNRLTALHHDAAVPLLHRRIQASLQFGALSISKETLVQVGRYKDDLQQRQRFIDLWLKTYDLQSLQAVAEVIVGREASQPPRLSGSPTQPAGSAQRKALEAFLKTFLVRNEDALRPRSSPGHSTFFAPSTLTEDEVGSPAWAWRRTVVRSLMLILLLDKAQMAGQLSSCLFQSSSPFKSSTAVVQALGNLLLPSIGNIARVLDHLSYHVSHIQYPLEEHVYHINNLATDLRDGVLLTRLVEILLYPPSSLEVQQQNLTVTLPSGDMLTSSFDCSDGQDCWVLSQHLKYPCISRVQKLYNVQIALSALRSVKDVGTALAGIDASDIVDGHREKNVLLLWSLVSRWGLSLLLDFDLVEQEVGRLRKGWRMRMRNGKSPSSEEVTADEGYHADLPYLVGLDRHTSLLKSWARNAARLHDVPIHNLSTSFADGEAYRAILAEYAGCAVPVASNGDTSESSPASPRPKHGMTSSSSNTIQGQSPPSVTQHLTNLSCSRAFISLFTTRSIPSSQTTISLLAFLASRLLPSARSHFAAMTIQRAWWRSQARFELNRRMKLKVLARECKTVVEQQRKIVEAAIRIQTWWRALEAFWTRPRERLGGVARRAEAV